MTVLFFASVREALGQSREMVPLSNGTTTVGDVRESLVRRGEPWVALASTRNLRAALNQEMCGFDAIVNPGDELAFFPPVTGG